MVLRHRLRVRALIALATAVQVLAIVFGVSVLAQGAPASAAQSVPYKVNFQGRLTDNSGNVLADGLYNIKFRLWTLSSGGANQWEAARVRGAADYRVQITNGLFNIQFGDTALGDPAITPALFNTGTGTLYLEVELPTPATATCATNGCAVFTEGPMTPRQPLASSPYAINSDALDGLDSSAFVQLSVSQQTGSINVSGNITTGDTLQANTVDAASAGALTLGGSNATGVTLAKSTTLGSGLTLSLQGTNALSLGSTTAAGGIVFKDGTVNDFGVTLTTPALAASYSLTLPAAAPGVSQCLKTDASVATTLTFASCGSGSSSLQAAYDGGSTITLSGSALTIRDASSPLAAAFSVQNNDGTVSYFDVAAGGLKVYDSSNNANYASLTSTGGAAVLSSSTGVVQIGQSSGNVNVSLTGGADRFQYTKTNTPAGAYSTDEFGISRSVTGAGNTLTGSLLKVEDLSTGSSVQATLLTLNQSNAAATGYLFRARTASVDKLTVDPAGNLFAAGTFALGNTGNSNLVTLSAPSGAAAYSLKLPAAAGSTSQCLQTGAGDATQLTFGSCGSGGSPTTLQNAYDNSSPAQILLADAKNLTFTAPDTATDSNVVMNFQCTVSCSAGGGAFAVQHNGTAVFSVNQNTSASSAFLFKPTTDSSVAFQVQNTGSTALFTADTVNTLVKIGTTTTATLANVRLLVTLAEVTDTLRIGDATDGFEVTKATGPLYRGTARPTRRLSMSPEFAGAVIRPDGTSNTGTMTTAYEAASGNNYYSWTTTQGTSQDYDVTVRVPVPMDYSALPASPQICFKGYSTNTTNSTLTLNMLDTANAAVTLSSASFTPGSASTWAETCRTINGTPTLTAGGFITLRMTMAALSASQTRLGEFRLDYLAKF